jgi:hypothetical protein
MFLPLLLTYWPNKRGGKKNLSPLFSKYGERERERERERGNEGEGEREKETGDRVRKKREGERKAFF